MQEVVVSSSPFSTWGMEFVKYQFIIGLGDGIPAILLCLTITYFTLSNNKRSNKIQKLHVIKSINAIFIGGVDVSFLFISSVVLDKYIIGLNY